MNGLTYTLTQTQIHRFFSLLQCHSQFILRTRFAIASMQFQNVAWHSGTLNSFVYCTHAISEAMMKRPNERCNETTHIYKYIYVTKAQMRSLIMMTMNAMWKQCKISLINFTPDVCVVCIRYTYVVLQTLKTLFIFLIWFFFSLLYITTLSLSVFLALALRAKEM